MKKFVSILFAVIMVAFATVPAFAAEKPVNSPVATTAPGSTYKFVVDIIPNGGGSGDYDFTTDIDEEGRQHVHLIPKPNPGYVFDHWEIEGPYTTEDKLTDPEIDLIITGDIVVKPIYKKEGSTAVETGTVDKDNSNTSPQTGNNDVLPYAVIMLSIAACGASVVMLVKTNKNK